MKKSAGHAPDPDHARRQAAEAAQAAREAAKDASVAARKAAKRAKEWAAPQVEHAKEWAEPRIEKAYKAGARKARPYAHKAGDKAAEWTDVAHAAIVGAAIPAVLAAIDDAAREPETKRGNSWAKVVIPIAIAAAAGAALVVWARRDQGRDPWAGEDDEWQFAGEEDFKDQLRRGVNKAVDAAADAARKAADAATSAASAAAEVISDRAAPAVEKVKETAVAEARKVRDAADDARARATEDVVHAFEDAEDVWDDDLDDSSTEEVAGDAESSSTASTPTSSPKGKGKPAS